MSTAAVAVHKQYLAKRNQDGSYSVSIDAEDLASIAYVDFYDEKTGQGYQRFETLRERRGREVEDYLKRCRKSGLPPRLFEMTTNARTIGDRAVASWAFEALDEELMLGFLKFEIQEGRWLSMIDGGTRLLGIQKALASDAVRANDKFDVRIFVGLSVPEEIAMFLLINEKQKRVRTDLSVRVVQGLLDKGELTETENKTLETVVPEADQWRYAATRIAARLNSDIGSPWRDRIQMPNDQITHPVKLQAYWSSLKDLLTDEDLQTRFNAMEAAGELMVDGRPADKTEFTIKVLQNFWRAVADVNPRAFEEPSTNVLWGSIGVTSCHMALAKVTNTIVDSANPVLSVERFKTMARESEVADYEWWFNRPGSGDRESYPMQRGEATTMIGHSGYLRLAKILEKSWRAALHASAVRPPASA